MDYAYGHDFGNADTAGVIVIDGVAQFRRSIPSVTAVADLAEFTRKRSAMGDTYLTDAGSLDSQEFALEYQGTGLFIGKLAYGQRNMTTTRGDLRRYMSRRSLEMLLCISGSLIQEQTYSLHVVTGLPIETFTAENRKRVRETLQGTHKFILNGKSRTAQITVERVIMEGAGVVIAHGTTDSIKQACIDIGGRTTDVFTCLGQRPIPDLCQGRALGVEAAGDLFNKRFQQKYGSPLEPQKVRSLLRATIGKGTWEEVYHLGEEVGREELRTWAQTALSDIGREIASFVASTLSSSETGMVASDIRDVLLAGGGAYYFEQEIRERIPHLVCVPEPEFGNAAGYAALADYFLSHGRRQQSA